MKNIIYIATSIDGFIARKDGNIDWLMEIPNPEGSDFGFNDFIKDIDAIVMGRNTFEFVEKFDKWPYTKPVFVLSSSLKTLNKRLQDKVEIINSDPVSVVKYLHSKKFFNIYIDGGSTIYRFLQQNLIDEMIITRIPILLGDGIPLFSVLKEEKRFSHIKTEVLNNSLVKTHYKRIEKN